MIANIAPRNIILFRFVVIIKALYWPIRLKIQNDLRFTHDTRIIKFGERVIVDFHYDSLIKTKEN